MKKFEYYVNILHYIIYKGDYKIHKYFDKVNPFMLIHKLPFQKKRYKKLGIDPNKLMNEVFENPEWGISSKRAGAIIGMLFELLGFSFFAVFKFLLYPYILDNIFMFAFFILFILIMCFFVFYQDKYLLYFKEFEKEPRTVKIKWAWASLGAIIGIILLFIASFLFIGKYL